MTKRTPVLWALLLVLVPGLAAGCGVPGTSSNEHERQVLVDYHFDQYAAVFAGYYPKQVSVRPGDTVVFKQSWNGEPHSVTFGTAVDDAFGPLWKYLKDGPPYPEKPPDDPADQAALKALEALPSAFSQGPSSDLSQQAVQPCYVESGAPPAQSQSPCADRTLKAFTGKATLYNSGIIRYQGDQGNTFRLPIAANAGPGTHYYYCVLHGPLMSGVVTIVPANQAIASQADVNKQAQAELKRTSDPLQKAFKEARVGAGVQANAGVVIPRTLGSSSLDEFVPRSIRTRVGQKVTWSIQGDAHTVSFNVPKYLPEISFARDGTVSYTKETTEAVAGPGFPVSGGGGGPPGPPAPTPPVHVDAGNYDGGHFLSSGLGGPNSPADEVTYSITFTKAGTYKYACLVHPQMVGEVVVQ